ncbi:MAG TPA: DUF302 domain-containing protein, partial [Candidatus Hydrogenedentes bacterium]|nr:DUF302 domain-containing protein [Candidatus Hydrogenedentota bacterium]
IAVVLLLPRLMLITQKSALGFDETVALLEQAIPENGWSSPGTVDLCASMQKHGVACPRRVKVVQMCQPSYAKDILATDPHVSCLMPCSVGIWENEDGSVYFSKMNTGLMGRLFGGNVARVMGGMVSKDERHILKGIAGRG